MDSIYIDKLEVSTHIGITEQERSAPQKLHVSAELFLDTKSAAASDDIADTVDYAAVCDSIKLLAETERKTIERFAEDIATDILTKYAPASVKVSVWKYILKDTDGVCVTIVRP